MGKLKVKKSVRKRFKITKTGKVLHGSQNTGHLMRHKNKARQRRQTEPGQLHGAFAKRIKKMMGVA